MILPKPRVCFRDSTIYREMVESPHWACEYKLDGYRALAEKGDVLSRAGKWLAAWPHPVWCDGEWVRGQGFTAFDLLAYGTRDCRGLPYGRRRILLTGAAEIYGFPVVATLDHPDPLPEALRLGHEGVVFKHISHPYPTDALTPWWVKCKN